MPNLQKRKKQIEKTENLQSVVGTMKSLAAVSIRQYERAVESLDEFNRAVERALQAVVRGFGPHPTWAAASGSARVAVVLGSDQGMCGKFNEDIFQYAAHFRREHGSSDDWRMLVVGARLAGLGAQEGWQIDHILPVPDSAEGIAHTAQDLLSAVGAFEHLSELVLLFSRRISGSTGEPASVRLLPLDREWFEEFETRSWPTNQLPLYTVDRDRLFPFLVRRRIFVSLYRALAHSLASEHAARLASMQAAEKNIDERLADLTGAYHRARQSSITEELLDIISGFRTLEA